MCLDIDCEVLAGTYKQFRHPWLSEFLPVSRSKHMFAVQEKKRFNMTGLQRKEGKQIR